MLAGVLSKLEAELRYIDSLSTAPAPEEEQRSKKPKLEATSPGQA